MLAFDVYVKKLLIEKIIDDLKPKQASKDVTKETDVTESKES